VTQFTVAVNRNHKDPQGEWVEETEWFRVVVWAQLAERTAEYLRKGNKVYVEGRIQTRQWEDQTGQKRYTTELVANQVTNLERRTRSDEDAPFPGSDEGGSRPSRGPAGPAGPAGGAGQAGPAAGGGERSEQPAPDYDDLPF
jgi:single-strand DNA-binding protein